MKRESILVYRLGSLGDTIISLPCFHKIRESFPDAHILLLTNTPVNSKAAAITSILGTTYFYDEVISYPIGTRNPGKLFKLMMAIRSRNVSTIVNLSAARTLRSTLRDRIFFFFSGIRTFIGFPSHEEDYTPQFDELTSRYEWEAHRLARRISRLGSIDLSRPQYWDLKLNIAEYAKAAAFLGEEDRGEKIIAVSIGTKLQSNDWGVQNWKILIGILYAMFSDFALVLFGSQEEQAKSQSCAEDWHGKQLNLCGKVTPRESAAILERCKLFIGHDSGPIHLASCVDTPTIGIYGSRNLPGQWFPKPGRGIIIYHRVNCEGCGLETCILEGKKCILSISVNEVVAAVQKLTGNAQKGESV